MIGLKRLSSTSCSDVWEGGYCPHIYMGFPGDSVVKNWPANAENADSVPESGRSPGEGKAAHSNILAGKSRGQRSLVG